MKVGAPWGGGKERTKNPKKNSKKVNFCHNPPPPSPFSYQNTHSLSLPPIGGLFRLYIYL